MIVRHEGDRTVTDRITLAGFLGVSARTIRRWCAPVGHDRATGAALYDPDKAAEQLAAVRRPGRPARAT